MLIQAAWAATQVRGRLQARYNRLVRRMGGPKNPAAKKKAIVAIAHTLLKIAYTVLKTGTGYQEPGADFYTRREFRTPPGLAGAPDPEAPPRLHRHHHHQPVPRSRPGGRLTTRRLTRQPPDHQPSGAAASPGIPALTAGQTSTRHQPCHRTGRGLLPRAQRDPVFVSACTLHLERPIPVLSANQQ
jgi:hypothetical protein